MENIEQKIYSVALEKVKGIQKTLSDKEITDFIKDAVLGLEKALNQSGFNCNIGISDPLTSSAGALFYVYLYLVDKDKTLDIFQYVLPDSSSPPPTFTLISMGKYFYMYSMEGITSKVFDILTDDIVLASIIYKISLINKLKDLKMPT